MAHMARALAALREDLRSRTIRARRRMPLVAGTLAGVAGAALAVTALLPSNSQPGHPATARLTAWTVDSQANGNIRGVAQFHPGQNSAVLVLHPSALPDGAGLFIFDRRAPAATQAKGLFPLAVGLVQASQQCTGS